MLQAITWTNVDPDLCRHIVSPDHNETNDWPTMGNVALQYPGSQQSLGIFYTP